METLLTDPAQLRAPLFLALLLGLLALEATWPRRRDVRAGRRWLPNFALALLNTLLLAALPLTLLGVAAWAQARGLGLFNQLPCPPWLAWPLCWLLLDLAIYVQHRALHRHALLWRLHRVHHSDLAFDASTGLRFHPGEMLLSLAWKAAVVVALGAAPGVVLLFEIGLSSFALWSHANLRYPAALEKILRLLLVTPELHRAHHSVHRPETDSNYGSVLSCWDRLFGSLTARPRDGHEHMVIGLSAWRQATQQRLSALLVQPLQSEPAIIPTQPQPHTHSN